MIDNIRAEERDTTAGLQLAGVVKRQLRTDTFGTIQRPTEGKRCLEVADVMLPKKTSIPTCF